MATRKQLVRAFERLDEELERFKDRDLPELIGAWELFKGTRVNNIRARRDALITRLNETYDAVEKVRYKLWFHADRAGY